MKSEDLKAHETCWIRIPSRGHEPRTGLTRGKIYALIKQGAVKTSNLRDAGKKTGCRLVHLPSLLAHIEKHVEVPHEERD